MTDLNATELSSGIKVVRVLSDCLAAVSHPARFGIVDYCSKPQRFSDIIFHLRLNPASFRFHSRVLMDCDLIEKPQRGVYQTTELGDLLLKLVNKAEAEISQTH